MRTSRRVAHGNDVMQCWIIIDPLIVNTDHGIIINPLTCRCAIPQFAVIKDICSVDTASVYSLLHREFSVVRIRDSVWTALCDTLWSSLWRIALVHIKRKFVYRVGNRCHAICLDWLKRHACFPCRTAYSHIDVRAIASDNLEGYTSRTVAGIAILAVPVLDELCRRDFVCDFDGLISCDIRKIPCSSLLCRCQTCVRNSCTIDFNVIEYITSCGLVFHGSVLTMRNAWIRNFHILIHTCTVIIWSGCVFLGNLTIYYRRWDFIRLFRIRDGISICSRCDRQRIRYRIGRCIRFVNICFPEGVSVVVKVKESCASVIIIDRKPPVVGWSDRKCLIRRIRRIGLTCTPHRDRNACRRRSHIPLFFNFDLRSVNNFNVMVCPNGIEGISGRIGSFNIGTAIYRYRSEIGISASRIGLVIDFVSACSASNIGICGCPRRINTRIAHLVWVGRHCNLTVFYPCLDFILRILFVINIQCDIICGHGAGNGNGTAHFVRNDIWLFVIRNQSVITYSLNWINGIRCSFLKIIPLIRIWIYTRNLSCCTLNQIIYGQCICWHFSIYDFDFMIMINVWECIT